MTFFVNGTKDLGDFVPATCNGGYHLDLDDNCLKCEIGTSSSGGSVYSCTSCIAGYYAPEEGLSQCFPCASGFILLFKQNLQHLEKFPM